MRKNRICIFGSRANIARPCWIIRHVAARQRFWCLGNDPRDQGCSRSSIAATRQRSLHVRMCPPRSTCLGEEADIVWGAPIFGFGELGTVAMPMAMPAEAIKAISARLSQARA